MDDLARLGQSIAGTMHGVKSEVEDQVKSRLETVLKDMDLVSREEYEVVREMAVAAREENAQLIDRVVKLGKEIASLKKKKK